MRVYHAIAFVLLYLREILVSTARLARLVVQRKPELHPQFVEVPLELKGDFSRFLFACLISMTPGSLSVALDSERGVLLVHLLDARDPEFCVDELKRNFEQPLLRVLRGH